MQPQVTIHVSTPDSPASVHTFTQPRISIGRTRDHKDGTNDIVLPAPEDAIDMTARHTLGFGQEKVVDPLTGKFGIDAYQGYPLLLVLI